MQKEKQLPNGLTLFEYKNSNQGEIKERNSFIQIAGALKRRLL